MTRCVTRQRRLAWSLSSHATKSKPAHWRGLCTSPRAEQLSSTLQSRFYVKIVRVLPRPRCEECETSPPHLSFFTCSRDRWHSNTEKEGFPGMSSSGLTSKTNAGGTGRQPAPPPPFLVKLLQMLSAQECEPYVAWSSEGTHIILRQVDKLGSEVLPKFFRHNKFTSYLRQVSTLHWIGKISVQIPPLSSCTSTASRR